MAGAVGWLTDRLAVHAGWKFPSFGYLGAELIWKLATLAILAAALRHWEDQAITLETTGFAPSDHSAAARRYPLRACAVVLMLAIVLSVTVGTSATQGSAFGTVHTAGIALVLAEILIRYPLTVFCEEAFFRGWLQPRLGPNGPVLSAVLWGVYHLQQTSTIPSVVIFGVVLGALRWRQGNVRTTAFIHYLSNTVFFLTTYT